MIYRGKIMINQYCLNCCSDFLPPPLSPERGTGGGKVKNKQG